MTVPEHRRDADELSCSAVGADRRVEYGQNCLVILFIVLKYTRYTFTFIMFVKIYKRIEHSKNCFNLIITTLFPYFYFESESFSLPWVLVTIVASQGF